MKKTFWRSKNFYGSLLALALFVSAGTASAQTTTSTNGGNPLNSLYSTATSTDTMGRGNSQFKHSMEVTLTGADEVPAVPTAMSGRMTVNTHRSEEWIQYNLHIANGRSITEAHLHCALRGQNGPPVVQLFGPSAGRNMNNGTLASGVIRFADILPGAASCSPNITTMSHLIQAIREGKIYVNVHTTAHPNGEIRGQLELVMHSPILDQNHQGDSIFENGDIRITELSMNGSATGTHTYMVTVSNSLLGRLQEAWNKFSHMFGSDWQGMLGRWIR